ncbi:hypothetical protein MNBD_GAMMA05-62 [hydrothermal vent metagenome]|uniref:Fungal lipase-type domain-containing protein n=1 Tax=hydrothermal vent metagenome TaxID=652676 RepID=A0A3B0W793_9ZZZZ
MFDFPRFFSSSVTLVVLIFISTVSSAESNQQKFTKNNFSHWLNAAYIAQATYQSNEKLINVLNKQNYEVQQLQQIEGFSVGYVLATNHKTKQHIIAVRGTANAENIMIDAAFVLVPDKLSGIKIHQGFLLSATDIYQNVKQKINPEYTINTIGHSLGGAVAIILAMMFDAQGYHVNEVITFGQPKVTNISGSRHFEHLNVTRLVTPKDVVPLVPPLDPMDLMNLSIFWHQGTEIILYTDKQFAVLTGIASVMRAKDFLNDIPGEQHINNHFMSTYIRRLTSKLTSPVEIRYVSDFRFSDWFGTPSTTNK